jgi:23S rRNA (uracil1939-C5)-methyltransferase
VDANVAAIRDLKANVEENQVHAEAVQADAPDFLKRLRETPDFVVLDPPRAGLPLDAVARLLELRPATILCLSCDPATLARDLALLTGKSAGTVATNRAASYEISEIHLFDLFPQTYHIESLVTLKVLE